MHTLFDGNDPQLVLFDLDGTLLDSVPDLALAVQRMQTQLQLPVATFEDITHWVGNGAQMLVQRALAGRIDPQGDEPDLALFEQAFPLFLEIYGNCCAERSQPYDGVLDFLAELKRRKIPMALVTNKPISFTRQLLSHFKLGHYFSVVLGGDSLAQKKPNPMQLLYAMNECNAEPESTLMVGDSRSDILAARAAGCPVVAVSYGYNHGEPVSQYQPDQVVDNLMQLVAV